MATKKKRTSASNRHKKGTGSRGGSSPARRKKARARGSEREDLQRQRYQRLASRPQHAELFVFLNAMRRNENGTADLFAAGEIDAALDASGVRLTAKQRERVSGTLAGMAPEELAAVGAVLNLPEMIKVALN